MATLVLAAGGAAMGTAMGWGMMGMTGAQVGWMAGSILGNVLLNDAPAAASFQGPRLSDLKVQTSTYGMPIPVIYGVGRASGNVIWSTDLIETATTTTSGGGGKGGDGGGGSSQTTYTYAVSCAVGICEGEIAGVRRIWANGELIYDQTTQPPGITVYTGSEDQLPSALIESYKGAGNVPAHRGLAHVTFENFQLQKYGNRTPNFSFEIVKTGMLGGVEYVGLSDSQEHPRWGYDATAQTVITQSWTGAPTWYATLNKYDIATNELLLTKEYPTFSGSCYVFTDFAEHCLWAYDAWYNDLHKIDIDTLEILLTIPHAVFYPSFNERTGDMWWMDYVYENNLLKINKTTGAIEKTITMPFYPRHVTFDASGNLWVGQVGSPTAYGLSVVDPDTGVMTEKHRPSSTADAVAELCYDENRNCIWFTPIATSQKIFKYDITGDTLTSYDLPFIPVQNRSPYWLEPSQYTQQNEFYDPVRDCFWFGDMNETYIASIDPDTLTVLHEYPADIYDWSGTFAVMHPTDKSYVMCWGHPGYVPHEVIVFNSGLTPGAVTLANIVADLCYRGGLSVADINVDQLTDIVEGYTVAQQMTVRSAIEALQTAFYFDAVESD